MRVYTYIHECGYIYDGKTAVQ